MVTIFTPTYNRAYTLPLLYESLCNQTCKEFVWLIVDDGSNDNTREKINEWKKEKKIEIQYYYQENSGKSAAHNRGVELTNTELFVCVDSDDYITNDAVEIILDTWSKINDREVIGILAFRGTKEGMPITTYKNNGEKCNTLKDFYYKKIIGGDTMLVYDTNVIKKYRFPQFENEKFVPEVYLYDLLDSEGKLCILPRILYICEYLDDGYTKNMMKLIADNPQGYLAWIEQRLNTEKLCRFKIANTIRYTAIAIKARKRNIIRESVYPIYTFLFYPVGYMLYRKKYRKYEDNK